MSLFRKNPAPQAVLDLRSTGSKPGSRSGRKTRHPGFSRPAAKIAIVLLVLIVGGGAGHYAWSHRPARDSGQPGMQHAVTEVGRLMYLPTDETPTYGTVADKTKLTGQTFFKNAQNGDEVLIYEKARLTILYRPSAHKIVNVGPVISGNGGSPYITSRIAILNGTADADLLTKMTAKVTSVFPNARIVAKNPASRSYPTSIVADLSSKNQPLAEQVADSLSLQGGKLPLGEPAPDADLLIIIGADYH